MRMIKSLRENLWQFSLAAQVVLAQHYQTKVHVRSGQSFQSALLNLHTPSQDLCTFCRKRQSSPCATQDISSQDFTPTEHTVLRSVQQIRRQREREKRASRQLLCMYSVLNLDIYHSKFPRRRSNNIKTILSEKCNHPG